MNAMKVVLVRMQKEVATEPIPPSSTPRVWAKVQPMEKMGVGKPSDPEEIGLLQANITKYARIGVLSPSASTRGMPYWHLK